MNPKPEQFKSLFSFLRHPNTNLAGIATDQNRKLRGVINHAYSHVPFYREWFDQAKITPQDIRTQEDLRMIPPISKEDLKQQDPGRLLAENFNQKRLGTFATSGSTGKPIVVRRSRYEDILFHLFRMKTILTYGLKRTDKFVRIRGSSNDQIPLLWKMLQHLGQYQQVMLSTFQIPERLSQLISREKPDVLTGYTGALVRVAQIFLEEKGQNPVQPRFLVSGGDMLTPHGQHYIQEAFNAPVYDTYESQEVGLIAWECLQKENYHVCDASVILEALKEGNPAQAGEQGEVVVTSLICYAMPIIRFKLEDMVTIGPSPCTCGHTCSTFKNLRGKMTDYFIMPDGRELNPWFIDIQVYKEAAWLEQYEVIQEREDTITLRAVLPSNKNAEELEPLRTRIQKQLGDGVSFRIESVSEIQPGPSGKYFYHRSLVQGAFARTYE